MTITPHATAGTVVEVIPFDGPMGPIVSFTNVQTEDTMNWDKVQGNWTQVKGKAKQMWGDLTDDELDTIAGKCDELVGRLHQVWHQQGARRSPGRAGSQNSSPRWLAGKSLNRAAEPVRLSRSLVRCELGSS
ncbi:MAG: CsbD family protein [Gammaproteobacteria bacterium]